MGGHGASSGYKKVDTATKQEIETYLSAIAQLVKNGEASPDDVKDMKENLADTYHVDVETINAIEDGTYGSKKGSRKNPDNLDGDKQAPTGSGVPDYYNTSLQDKHPQYDVLSVAARTGTSAKKAQDLKDALYEDDVGGFTRGWDEVIRAYQRGASKSDIKAMSGTVNSIYNNFGGDENAYFAALKKKADSCEELIDRSPKWSGSETFRGFKNLSPQTMSALTNTSPDAIINLNAGTASWSTNEYEAYNFSSSGQGSLVAHVTGSRRGTSVKMGSYFQHEDEVLCSRREAFRCVRVEHYDGRTHAWYEVVDTDYDWS